MFDRMKTGKYPLIEALQEQLDRVDYRFHVPAHLAEHGVHPASAYDLTELRGLDNLFEPVGAIARSQELAADFFGADETCYLVNGSSAGLIAAIWSSCRRGEKVILGRNVHRSAITGLIWSGAVPRFIPVKEHIWGIPLNINVAIVEAALSEKGFSPTAMVITNPSYHGISTDADALRTITARKGMTLIVDEAHGGHFVFCSDFPRSAASIEADLWVNSAHKTLGALTPGALLHRKGKRADPARLKNVLGMVQTSSPSYAVLASLEMIQGEQEDSWKEAIRLSRYARREINARGKFICLEESMLPAGFSMDPLRLTIRADKVALNGFQIAELLKDEHRIEVELAGYNNLVSIIHPGHRRDDIDALVVALERIGERYGSPGGKESDREIYPLPAMALAPRDAAESPWRELPLGSACGCISAVTVLPFPPGTPVLIPGEVISREIVEQIIADCERGYNFLGLGSGPSRPIMVVDDDREKVGEGLS